MLRFYSKPINGSRVTVVGEYSEGVLNLAVACCSSNDNFMKKKGRLIAEGRFNKGLFIDSVPIKDDTSIATFIEQALRVSEEVATNNEVVPGRVYMK